MSDFTHDGISGRQLTLIDNDELFSAETGQKFATVRDEELYSLDGETLGLHLKSLAAVGEVTPEVFLRLLGRLPFLEVAYAGSRHEAKHALRADQHPEQPRRPRCRWKRRHGAVIRNPSHRVTSNAFWQACAAGERRMADYLLEEGADVNWIPLMPKRPPGCSRQS